MDKTKPKPFVFVLMPFSDDFTDVYEVGIKPACKDAGAYCERVDEQIFLENIIERVYNQIAKADVIIGEMTGRNPNVFYEVGYAHALNKRAILLTRDAADIPFDLKHYPHIVYGSKIASLKSQLEAKVRWCVENPSESLSRLDLSVSLSIEGMAFDDQPLILTTTDSVYFRIDLHNLSNKILSPESIGMAIIFPQVIAFNDPHFVAIPLPDKSILYNVRMPELLFPDSWAFTAISFSLPNKTDSMDVVIRLFTEFGPKDHLLKIVRHDYRSTRLGISR